MVVLIVDDQDVVRQGLVKMIRETNIGMEAVLEASDGEEALRVAQESDPDLILVDIMMPRLNGIELIESLKASGSRSHFAIISAYSDFDFAKKAIGCKVDDYLLKPVSQTELYKLLIETKDKIEDDSAVSRRLRDRELMYYYKLLYDCLTGRDALANLSEILDALGFKAARPGFMVAVAGASAQGGFSEKDLDAVAAALSHADISLLVFPREKSRIIAIGNMESSAAPAFERAAGSLASRYSRSGACFGVSEWLEGEQSLRKLYEQAFGAMKEAAGSGVEILKYSDMKSGTKVAVSMGECSRLLELINCGDKKGADALLDGMFFRMEGKLPGLNDAAASLSSLVKYLGTNIELLYPGQGDVKDVQDRLLEATTVFRVKSIAREAVDTLFARVAEVNKKDHASYVVNFLITEAKKRFPGKVSLGELAGALGMNYNYVSGLFNKKIGVPFSEYIVGYRLEKAREMLGTGKWKISEVSDQCGFYDSKYFAKAFKKAYGMTPGEFRNK